jgi:hypothetical protein
MILNHRVNPYFKVYCIDFQLHEPVAFQEEPLPIDGTYAQ